MHADAEKGKKRIREVLYPYPCFEKEVLCPFRYIKQYIAPQSIFKHTHTKHSLSLHRKKTPTINILAHTNLSCTYTNLIRPNLKLNIGLMMKSNKMAELWSFLTCQKRTPTQTLHQVKMPFATVSTRFMKMSEALNNS